jgi:ribosomal protein S18 acetylase RimI-like enzyme
MPGELGIVTRPLGAVDREAVQEALGACGAFSQEEIGVALELFDAGLAGDYVLFGAERGGRLQGYICLGKASLTAASWYLYWMCVHPDAQRLGLGRALQLRAEAFVRSQGGERIVLETSGRSDYGPARRFYEKAGYLPVGCIPDFYRPGDDCLIYFKTRDRFSDDRSEASW